MAFAYILSEVNHMFRTIRNYLTIISLGLVFSTTTMFAAPIAIEGAKTKTIKVDSSKDYSFYNEVLANGGKDTYTFNVGIDKTTKVVIRSEKAISLKVQAPDGSFQSYAPEKYFSLELRSEGEYTLDLESISVSLYTLEVTQ